MKLPEDKPLLLVVRAGGFTAETDARIGRPLTPREALLSHIDRFDVRGQCAEIRASLAAAAAS